MSRIRSVHPALFTDEAWVSCSPIARLLVIGLWTDADDQGVFEWKPLQIKMRLLPGDSVNCAELLHEIEAAGIVMAFDADGKRYGAIKNFRRFQRPQKPNAIHPLPETVAAYVCLSITDTVPVEDAHQTNPVIHQQMEDGGGRVEEETTASDKSSAVVVAVAPPKPKATKRCPMVWLPSEADLVFASGEGFSPGEIDRELAKIRDYQFRDAHSDWGAVFRNWIRRAADHPSRRALKPHERPDQPSPKRTAREDNLARAFAASEAVARSRAVG